MSHGIEVYGPDNSSVVWSSNIRASNIQVLSYFDLDVDSSPSFTCLDADDLSKVVISFFNTNQITPLRGVKVTSRTSTGFTIGGVNSFSNREGYVIAVRIA